LDSVTLEDWGEEIFAEGVGMGKGGGGGEEKNPPLSRLCTKPLPAKHPVTIQDGSIEAIYLAFRIPLRNNACTAGYTIGRRIFIFPQHVCDYNEVFFNIYK